jgi:PTS system mannose-specific IIA component
MVGVLVVTHCRLAEELISATRLIVGKLEQVSGISIDPQRSVEELRQQVEKAIKDVDRKEGVLIMTDMFGGTPSNICLSFLEEGKVEVLTGVNLPMLVKLFSCRDKKKLGELAEFMMEYGRKNISLASEILKKRENR